MKINYGFQTIENDDIKSVIKILKSKYLTQGPEVNKFENNLSKKLGSKYCLAVNNGTALHLAGKALNWKNDIVITTPITFLSTANSIVMTEASPVFIDIDKDTYTISTTALEEKIKELKIKGKKVKSVIGVDYAGHPCDWKKLKELSKKYKFTLVNDNCHALGAKYKGDDKYAVKYADIVVQSFHPVKNITTGEGGALLTNNYNYFKKVRSLRSHGTVRNSPWKYQMKNLGYNYRLPDINCALGNSQLKKLNIFVKKRNNIANNYFKKLRYLQDVKLPIFNKKKISHAFHLFALKVNFNKKKISKDLFLKKMLKNKIKLQVHYIPIYKQKYYKEKFNFNLKNFPIANKFYQEQVSLPIYPKLSTKEQNYVIKKIFEILK